MRPLKRNGRRNVLPLPKDIYYSQDYMNDKIKDAVNLSKLHLVMCVPSLSDFANNHLFQANCKAISCHVFGITLLIALALTRQSEVSDSIALSRKLCLETFYLHTAPCLFPSLPTLTCMVCVNGQDKH